MSKLPVVLEVWPCVFLAVHRYCPESTKAALSIVSSWPEANRSLKAVSSFLMTCQLTSGVGIPPRILRTITDMPYSMSVTDLLYYRTNRGQWCQYSVHLSKTGKSNLYAHPHLYTSRFLEYKAIKHCIRLDRVTMYCGHTLLYFKQQNHVVTEILLVHKSATTWWSLYSIC